MRHAKVGNRLSRNQSLRKATIRDMAKATLVEQRICTTKAKAKEARKMVEKLITLGKKGTLAAKRKAFAILCDHNLVSNLFNSISGRFKSRAGGYTRIILLNNRRGDNAQMVFLELTEKDQIIVSKSRSEAQGKIQDAQIVEEKGKDVPSGKIKKEEKSKSEGKSSAPKKELGDDKAKPKPKPKLMGGIKKIFKKPSTGGS